MSLFSKNPKYAPKEEAILDGGSVKIVNYSGREINVWNAAKEKFFSIPNMGNIWLEIKNEHRLDVGNVPVYRAVCTGGKLPPEQEGVIYIVSRLVASIFPEREDFFITGKALRDNTGAVLGCHGITRPIAREF